MWGYYPATMQQRVIQKSPLGRPCPPLLHLRELFKQIQTKSIKKERCRQVGGPTGGDFKGLLKVNMIVGAIDNQLFMLKTCRNYICIVYHVTLLNQALD